MVRNEEREEVRREDPPLRNPEVDTTRFGKDSVIRDEGGASTQECSQPAEEVWMKGRRERGEFLEEEGVIDGVEGFGEVESGGDGAQGRLRLVEAKGHLGGEWKEGGGAGASRSSWGCRYRRRKPVVTLYRTCMNLQHHY